MTISKNPMLGGMDLGDPELPFDRRSTPTFTVSRVFRTGHVF